MLLSLTAEEELSVNGKITQLTKFSPHTKKLSRLISGDSWTVPSGLPTQTPYKETIRTIVEQPLEQYPMFSPNLSMVKTSPKGSVAGSFRVLPFNKMAVNKGKALTYQAQNQQKRKIFVPSEAKEFFKSMQTNQSFS